MKSFVTFTLLSLMCLISIVTTAQIKPNKISKSDTTTIFEFKGLDSTWNENINSSDSTQITRSNFGSIAVVSAIGFNVVYVGIDNPLAIAIPGYLPKDIQVTTSWGRLEAKPNSSEYILKLDSAYDGNQLVREVIISVFIKDNNNKLTEKANYRFRIRKIPLPTLALGSISENGVYPINLIKSSSFVFCHLKDFAFEGVQFSPKNYSIRYIPKIGVELELKGTGPAITTEIRNAFNHATSGDKFILTNVTAKGPIGLVEVPYSLTIEVK